MKRLAFTLIVILLGMTFSISPLHAESRLRLQVFVSDSNSYCVTSTLIAGDHEAILVDAQYRLSEAVKLADQVSASGKRLNAIIITHPDLDHYLCMGFWKTRFPATPIYMSGNALKEFKRTAMKYFTSMKKNYPAETPDSLPTPELLPAAKLTLEGEEIEVVTDLQGDTWTPSNSYVWIPSLQAVIAGDIVFNGVHVWLANSTRKSRTDWLHTLDRLEERHPRIVIAGHKWSDMTPDSPDVIAATRSYIRAFNDAEETATGSDDLIAIMKHEFKQLNLIGILGRAARAAIPD